MSNQMSADGAVAGQQFAHLRLGLVAQVLIEVLLVVRPKSQLLPAPFGSCQSCACE